VRGTHAYMRTSLERTETTREKAVKEIRERHKKHTKKLGGGGGCITGGMILKQPKRVKKRQTRRFKSFNRAPEGLPDAEKTIGNSNYQIHEGRTPFDSGGGK